MEVCHAIPVSKNKTHKSFLWTCLHNVHLNISLKRLKCKKCYSVWYGGVPRVGTCLEVSVTSLILENSHQILALISRYKKVAAFSQSISNQNTSRSPKCI